MQNFRRNSRKANELILSEKLPRQYIGRFAPSPTGPLHLGSLSTALASYLDAKSQQGLWRLRIDDLDTPRNQAGSIDSILTCLEAFGLHWDGEVYYQSQHLGEYGNFLNQLDNDHLTYRCECSRKTLAELAIDDNVNGIYPGICRNKMIAAHYPYAIRIKTNDELLVFHDSLQGKVSTLLAKEHGDFILKRKDNIIAYQLAVVVDDHLQKVSHVVRGCDLLTETAKQIYLQQLLGFSTPHYAHVPVIVDTQGFKLSKQTLATAVDSANSSKTLFKLLRLLKQKPPDELRGVEAKELLEWAIKHWHPEVLRSCSTLGL